MSPLYLRRNNVTPSEEHVFCTINSLAFSNDESGNQIFVTNSSPNVNVVILFFTLKANR